MGLISRVSSRTYRRFSNFQNFSKLSKMYANKDNSLRVEVMQLSAPYFFESNKVPYLEHDKINNPALADLNLFDDTNDQNFESMLTLPSQLANNYIGETFTICCSVRLQELEINTTGTISPLKNIKIVTTMARENQSMQVLYEQENLSLTNIYESIDFVASHDLKQAGFYRLVIQISYNIDGQIERKTLNKKYDIKVVAPLKISINYPYLNTKTVIAEVSVQNISKTDMVLTDFEMVCLEKFRVINEKSEEEEGDGENKKPENIL